MIKKILYCVVLICSSWLFGALPGEAEAKIMAKSAEIAGLQTTKLTLQGALEAAEQTLRAYEKSTGFVVEGVRAVVKGVTSAVRITGMKAHAAPRELIEGKIPNVEITLMLMGKEYTIKGLTFDTKNPQKSLSTIANSILDSVDIF